MDKTNYFKALTGYRAMAAYMVFICHLDSFASGSFLSRFAIGFRLGVPLFFVLSGFLIYTRYNSHGVTASFYKKYMTNRVARIYPIYFLIMTATWLFNFKLEAFHPHNLKVYFINITFLQGFLEKYANTLLTPAWSLSAEETFYLMAPILFMLAGASIKKYIFAYLAIFSFGWVLSFISIRLLHGFLWQEYKFMLIKTFFGHSFAFVTGICIGILNHRYKGTSFKYFTVIGFLGIFIALLVMSRFSVVAGLPPETYTWRCLFVSNFAVIPFVGLLVWGLIRERTWISTLFSTELFQILGKSSYCFYLIHLGIIHSVIHKFITENTYVLFGLLILISYLLWRFVEDPMNGWIRGFAEKH